MLYAILKFLDSFPSKKEKEKNTRIYSSKFSIAKDYLKDFLSLPLICYKTWEMKTIMFYCSSVNQYGHYSY